MNGFLWIMIAGILLLFALSCCLSYRWGVTDREQQYENRRSEMAKQAQKMEMEWQTKILNDYPDQGTMGMVRKGFRGTEVGDSLAEYVYHEVMDAKSQVEAYEHLKSGLADIGVCVWELDRRIMNQIDEDPTSNVETPIGEAMGGE